MLEIAGLGFQYAGAKQAALADVALNVERGEVFGLLGPNGAGKTTLISHLAGLIRPQTGSITVDGLPLSESRRKDPTRIAIAPQEYAFYPMLTVAENLRCFAGVCKNSEESPLAAVERCLAFAQLADWRDVRAERLSGGLKRRLNLAIALLARPDLVLLDEPTVGVDPQSRAFLLDVVKALAAEGAAVIYTTHYMEEIEAIADRVAILDHGRVLRCGRLDELLRVGGQRLELTVDAVRQADTEAVLGRHGSPQWHGRRVTCELNEGVSALAVLGALADAGISVEQASFGRGTLEDLFMKLTHRSLRDH